MAIAVWRFFQTREQIEHSRFNHAAFPELMVVSVTVFAGAAMIACLAVTNR